MLEKAWNGQKNHQTDYRWRVYRPHILDSFWGFWHSIRSHESYLIKTQAVAVLYPDLRVAGNRQTEEISQIQNKRHHDFISSTTAACVEKLIIRILVPRGSIGPLVITSRVLFPKRALPPGLKADIAIPSYPSMDCSFSARCCTLCSPLDVAETNWW